MVTLSGCVSVPPDSVQACQRESAGRVLGTIAALAVSVVTGADMRGTVPMPTDCGSLKHAAAARN